MTISTSRRPATLRRIGVATATAALLTVAPATSASALHNYCGPGAAGIHLNGFAGGSLANGHPDGASGNWAGLAGLTQTKQTLFNLDRASEKIGLIAEIAAVPLDDIPGAGVALANEIAQTIILAIERTASATLIELEAANAELNACNDVLMADLVDSLFVGRMLEDLAFLDYAASGIDPGQRLSPAAMFLLPDDDIPSWSQDSHPSLEFGGEPAALTWTDGFQNAPYIGVATVVRNEIAHLGHHGIAVGRAQAIWQEAFDLHQQGQLRAAYAKFAEAYQQALNADGSGDHPPSHAEDTGGWTPPPDH